MHASNISTSAFRKLSPAEQRGALMTMVRALPPDGQRELLTYARRLERNRKRREARARAKAARS